MLMQNLIWRFDFGTFVQNVSASLTSNTLRHNDKHLDNTRLAFTEYLSVAKPKQRSQDEQAYEATLDNAPQYA
jgi:hypothetical protein